MQFSERKFLMADKKAWRLMHIVHHCQSPLSKKGEENVQREDLASGMVSILRQRCILD